MDKYDVAIIGGGPGGYLAAERLGHRGKNVLLVEKQHIGGTCLNVGCIPTKSLLNSAKLYLHAKESDQFGIHAQDVSFDMGEMMAWKQKTVETLCAGVSSSLKRCKVEVVSGEGVLVVDGAKRGVKVGDAVYEAKAVIVAAGSVPAMPPLPGVKGNPQVLDSTGLLSVSAAPAKLAVIGGGVIGMEFASLFSSLGTQVDVIEMLDEIIPPMDKDHALLMRRALKGGEGRAGVSFHLGCQVTKVEGGTVFFTPKASGAEESVTADLVLMAVGRRAETASWGAKEAGIDIARAGAVVDDRMRTNVPGVWAVGDVNGRSMLAHSAYRMAEIAVNDICFELDGSLGGNVNRNVWRGNAVPWVVYSLPEAAGVGLTEQEASAKGVPYKKATAPMAVSGRFIAENGVRAPGHVKILADPESGLLLGIHVLGPYASEMIWGAAALLEMEARVQDVKEMIFPHPTVSEAIREAVWNMS
jgi:dihydrolipoamide dehydrogenase